MGIYEPHGNHKPKPIIGKQTNKQKKRETEKGIQT